MNRWRAEIDISLEERASVTYQLQGVIRPPVFVDDLISPTFKEEVGLGVGRLHERHVAFLLLLILDSRRELPRDVVAGKETPQRVRFAHLLGMSTRGFRKWAERNIPEKQGRILRWEQPTRMFHEPSRTGGPWWLAGNSHFSPDTRTATEFIERQGRVGVARRQDPSELFEDASKKLGRDDWTEAVLLLEEAREMYRRRRWSRKDPLWFKILLILGHGHMQLGGRGLRPDVPVNILRSITRQALAGPEINIIRARAHHIAALILGGQRPSIRAARSAIQHLQRAQELLRGQPGEAAQRYWESRSYEETCLARLNATARPKGTSAILQAAQVLGDRADEMRMRYGESLLAANQPSQAIRYIESAAASGRLSAPAWVIAERLSAAAQWVAGQEPVDTLSTLEDAEQKAHALGFDHQVRLIQRQRKFILGRIRKPVIR